MFYFEDEPHDDGTFVHEAVQSLVGEVVDVAMPSRSRHAAWKPCA